MRRCGGTVSIQPHGRLPGGNGGAQRLPVRKKADYSGALWTTFTDPELARFGLTEQEAKEKYGDGIRIYRVPYSALDRAKTDSTESGIAKFILNKKGMLIGAHILGMIAGEIIHEAQIFRCLKLPLSRCRKILHAYPSYSDITRIAGNKAKIDEIMSNPFVKIALKLFSNRGKQHS
jgi:pyruvate/2-oxoglutarate dehydrogenase complex dihydrolipoamide dehydrogenase (E3) component